ncbi:MAG: alpha/beta fold hydrolase [Myxococcota bacterium]|nr:alpha/beta fold hydrolase [Myxococcota bacterium]
MVLEQWPAPSFAEVRGRRIAYRDLGEARPGVLPVVAVHGLGSSSLCWARNAEALARRGRAVVVDLPGYGASDKAHEPLSLREKGAIVGALLRHLGIRRAVWVGHSMGGQIALHRAIEAPREVAALTLVAPAGFERFSVYARSMLQNAVTRDWVLNTHSEPAVRRNLAMAFHDMPPEAELLVRARLAFEGEELEGYAAAVVNGVRGMLSEPVELERLEVPTSIVFGLRDRLIPNPLLHPHLSPRKLAESGARRIRDARLFFAPDAGHLLQFEAPDAFAQALDACFDSLSNAA